jgi:hypothetical protein
MQLRDQDSLGKQAVQISGEGGHQNRFYFLAALRGSKRVYG